jgi:hypothetical protein
VPVRARVAAYTATSAKALPAPWYVTGLGAVAALVTATASLSPAWSAAVFSAAAATGTILTAVKLRPVEVPVITGSATVILGDLALLGLKVPPEVLGALTGTLTFALGAVLHLMHVQFTMSAPGPVASAAVRQDPGSVVP